ncbi:hypothetical protein Efla_005373 [Eimeria flavescens]
MATDGSLLQLEEYLGDGPVPASCRVDAIGSCSKNSSSSKTGGPSLSTQAAAREAALAATAEAASLSERCRSLLPLLKEAAHSGSSKDSKQDEASLPGSHTNLDPLGARSSSSSSRQSGKPSCKTFPAEGSGLKGSEFLEFDSDEEGPVVELDVGVGVLDVNGLVPDDARLAELGVQVVDLPEDSPVLQGNTATASKGPQLDPLQTARAALGPASCGGQGPLVSVLSSGSSSEEEDGSDDDADG